MTRKLILLVVVCAIPITVLFAQNKQLTVRLKNGTIKELSNILHEKHGYSFMYNNLNIDDKQNVSVDVENGTIDDVLKQALKSKKLEYELAGNQIVLKPIQESKLINVTGQVLDAGKSPIVGVSIYESGTNNGGTSDVNGNFSISVHENAKLTVSFVGFRTQEVNVNKRSVLNISMQDDAEVLGEVVVTALGIKREDKALGYAVQKIGGEGMQTNKVVDAGTALTGKVAGLTVKNSTEFAEAPSLELRGESPIVVIDGVPYTNMTLRDIPNDDIESISILKGATASALYGARGGSGAIMVTTKRGAASKGISVSVNSNTMFSAGFLAVPKTQSTFGRAIDATTNEYKRTADGSWGVPMDGREIVQWNPFSKSMQAMPYLPIGANNFSNFLEQSYILNNNVNVVQQGELGSFRASATWVQNKGAYPNSIFNKYTFSIGGEIKKDKFSLSSTMAYNKQQSPNAGFSGYEYYDPMYSLLIWSAPDWDVRNYKDYWLVENETQNNSYIGGNNNPYFDRNQRTHALNRDVVNGMLALNYEFCPWLKATFRSGFDMYSDRQDVKISQGSFQGAGKSTVIKNGSEVWGESMKGSFNTGIGRGYSLNNEMIFSLEQSFSDFRLDGFVGGSIFYQQDDAIEAFTRGGLNVPAFYSLAASINPVLVNSRISRLQTNSIFGRLGVSWRSLIFMEATLRNDWSSTLPKSTRSYLYPSVAGSFIVSEILPKTDWLSLWKIRSSWTTSKRAANIYDVNSAFSLTQNAWGNSSSLSLPDAIRASTVFPESATTFEIGSVVNFLNNRLSLDAAYYTKRMFDFIKNANVSDASGFSRNYINIDEEITRKGVELVLNIVPIRTKDVDWNVMFNWSKMARYYTKLDDNFSTDQPWVQVGKRVDHYVMRNYEYHDGQIVHDQGLPQYERKDGLVGYSDPNWVWGIGSGLRVKNWDFNVAIDGRVGGLTKSTTEAYLWRSGAHPNSVNDARYMEATQGGAHYVGDGLMAVSGEVKYDNDYNIVSDTRVFASNTKNVTYKSYTETLHKGTAWGSNGSMIDTYSTTFLKLRELSCTYNFPKSVASKIKAQKLAVSAVGQNLFLWAKDFKYSDPDGGMDDFSDPSLRYIGINVQINF